MHELNFLASSALDDTREVSPHQMAMLSACLPWMRWSGRNRATPAS